MVWAGDSCEEEVDAVSEVDEEDGLDLRVLVAVSLSVTVGACAEPCVCCGGAP